VTSWTLCVCISSRVVQWYGVHAIIGHNSYTIPLREIILLICLGGDETAPVRIAKTKELSD